jgi:NAD(P)-dependent dehydrogenase (short-subunit alcohol dehydrogenase family)
MVQKKVCVTGASGKAGRAVVTGLRAHGYDVTPADVVVTSEVPEFGTLLAIDRARQVLGFEPAHSWRDHIKP